MIKLRPHSPEKESSVTEYSTIIAQALKIKPSQTAAAIQLLDEGNTVPFIARYRKEMTGTLDEEQLRSIQSEVDRLRTLDERKAAVLASINEQGKLTPELEDKICKAATLTAVEDLYAPYKPKRRTRASIAREKGLQELAEFIINQSRTSESAEKVAEGFLNEQVLTIEDALAGARDITAETISDHADVRRLTRERALQFATVSVEKVDGAKDEKRVYELYYDYENRVDKLHPHQVLAIDRGESDEALRVTVQVSERDWLNAIHSQFCPDPHSPFSEQLELAIRDSANRLLLPAIERDVRRELSVNAQLHAIRVFADNMRGLLNQPPLAGHVILGLDPGFRTGCKVAVVDTNGKLLHTGTIYPHEPQKKWIEALENLRGLIARLNVTLISIGNGTASRETEHLAAELIKDLPGVKYIITNEAGASVYSASPLARQEMPDLDVSLRGAASIARRVQDPLAELVKIDPRSIGVGLYQHDVDQGLLKSTLDGVVEDVVNRVGVNVNSASPALLAYVAGIGPKLAEKMVSYRDENGSFTDRTQFKKVAGLGPRAFEQSAGFLRIRGGKNTLDASAIHPESYPVAHRVMARAGMAVDATLTERRQAVEKLRAEITPEALAVELGCGVHTLTDILEQLVRPGRDPRQDAPTPILRGDVLKMEDLAEGMKLKGTVRNVVDFGAFVDIGVKQDGLVHRSQMPFGAVLQVADVIEVEIIKVEIDRGRISLRLTS
ncbi:MAG: RNA-binding transcriptional accessory protein [Anaerolinea sp.]|nr:RNA-binding transcriptional accessory protein [Anaerolinea sp.]